ncbi:HD-GYP domain-containing protein [Robertmurraya massiliosenegalensis]|uniref:HD-GYP domain-containing protein n=1 Tax=Robertmurraya massiliosenegalensis TaxID=1287657 RepID=UPI0002DFD85C|nr:HD-GYP domain-containing protein [Robertmurraya massiliosenegalensis]
MKKKQPFFAQNTPMTTSETEQRQWNEPDQPLTILEKYDPLLLKKVAEKITAASKQMESIFFHVRGGRDLPLEEIKEKIIPVIHEAAKIPHIYHLFYQLNEKESYTYRHPIAVAIISTLIGKWLKLNEQELEDLTLGATLYDIGKASVPSDVLNKTGKLTREEYEIMSNHTVYGYNLLKNTEHINENVALIALQHHEREDGNGYPIGISGAQISYFAKIVAVADVFHAMSSPKIYHEALPFYGVIKQMEHDTFGRLDPKIVLTFLHKVMDSLVGRKVLLSDGNIGTIVLINPYDPIRCLVQTEDRLIDLKYNHHLQIERVLEDH